MIRQATLSAAQFALMDAMGKLLLEHTKNLEPVEVIAIQGHMIGRTVGSIQGEVNPNAVTSLVFANMAEGLDSAREAIEEARNDGVGLPQGEA